MDIPLSDHYVISVSYGNDSVAMIQWAHEYGLALLGQVTVVYCDTGWAKPGWMESRVLPGMALARSYSFNTEVVTSMGMEELVKMKKGWPGNGQQFCTAHLKGIPYLMWLDEADKAGTAITLVGKRRDESEDRKDTPWLVEQSEFHGDRRVFHPLCETTEAQRNELVRRSGMELLPHRSMECNPCVNANRGDLLRLTAWEMARVNRIEVDIGKPMFRPKRFKGMGIYGVVMWARHGPNHSADPTDLAKFKLEDVIDEPMSGCAAAFACGR